MQKSLENHINSYAWNAWITLYAQLAICYRWRVRRHFLYTLWQKGTDIQSPHCQLRSKKLFDCVERFFFACSCSLRWCENIERERLRNGRFTLKSQNANWPTRYASQSFVSSRHASRRTHSQCVYLASSQRKNKRYCHKCWAPEVFVHSLLHVYTPLRLTVVYLLHIPTNIHRAEDATQRLPLIE